MKAQDYYEWRSGGTMLTARRAPDSNDRYLVLRLTGELDMASAPTLAYWLALIAKTTPAIRIVIDLADLEFCDIAGVRALVSAHRQAASRGIVCHVRNPRRQTAWLLYAADAGDLIEPGP
jgi:anti-anti-sigma factor